MNTEDTNVLTSLIPILIISALYAWGNYHLAERTGRNGILYAVLTMIPGFGFVVTVYLIYRSILFAIDRSSVTSPVR